jgi:hypothetical protein
VLGERVNTFSWVYPTVFPESSARTAWAVNLGFSQRLRQTKFIAFEAAGIELKLHFNVGNERRARRHAPRRARGLRLHADANAAGMPIPHGSTKTGQHGANGSVCLAGIGFV